MRVIPKYDKDHLEVPNIWNNDCVINYVHMTNNSIHKFRNLGYEKIYGIRIRILIYDN